MRQTGRLAYIVILNICLESVCSTGIADAEFLGEAGQTGPKVLRGPPGEKGNMGYDGIAGMPGLKGARGQKGLKGEKGEPGIGEFLGVAGQIGLKGEPGDVGPQGPMGNRGYDGIAGMPGLKGARGQKGLKGEKGEPGIGEFLGVAGQIGLKGEPGDVGPQGPMGDRGVPGINGSPGLHGLPGMPGLKGARGQEGLTGEKGEPGNIEFPGVAGQTELKMLQGPPGKKGDMGYDGIAGMPGLKGARGQKGLKGEKGEPGNRDTLLDAERYPLGSFQNPGKSCAEVSEYVAEYYVNPSDKFAVECIPERNEMCLNPTYTYLLGNDDILGHEPLWLSENKGFNLYNFYNIQLPQIAYLQSISIGVRQKIGFYCYNVDLVSTDGEPLLLSLWNGQISRPYSSLENPISYHIEENFCNESTNSWKSALITLKTKLINRLPVLDVYITDIRQDEEQRFNLRVEELCFTYYKTN